MSIPVVVSRMPTVQSKRRAIGIFSLEVTMSFVAKLRREATDGTSVPYGWRIAWHEPARGTSVYYPIPLHWFVRVIREFAYRLRVALRAPRIEDAERLAVQHTDRDKQRFADEYARGYLAGWRECFQTCLEAVEQEIARADGIWSAGDLLIGKPRSSREN